MANYRLMYRLGVRPWERYVAVSGGDIDARLRRLADAYPEPRGRGLDIGCGRGMYTPRLAALGWQATGIDLVPEAIEAARARGDGVEYVVGDATRLPQAVSGPFEIFLDVGCFQGLAPQQRADLGRGVTELAGPGASLLMLQFGPSRWQRLAEGVARSEIESAFAGWTMASAEPAPTAGLGFPMNRTNPTWYWLRRDT